MTEAQQIQAIRLLRSLRQPEDRLSFRAFVSQVKPRYQWYKHCEILAARLQDIADGRLSRLMVFLPPRHGKSELVSRLFPAYYLYRHPERWAGLNSYAAELAFTLSHHARDNYLGMGGTLKQGSSAVKHFETPQHGGLWAAGVGGPITGKGFHFGGIDDPIKNAEDAASEVIREKHKEWYRSTFYTREEPQGAIAVVQCMTGDTLVLMANGSEIPLRDIKLGDKIATYDKGKLTTSIVRNHASNGRDSVYKITTISGIIVHANERHPFLTEENGEFKWIRLKYLTTAHRIVTLKSNGANGRAKLALPISARNLPFVADSVMPITRKRSGLTGIVRRQLMLRHSVTDTLSIHTELLPQNTTPCCQHKTGNALSANSLPAKTFDPIGQGRCALTIATKPTRLEGFCVTTAISLLDMQNQKKQHSQCWNTSDFTSEKIKSIEPAGVEEVFDIQVDRTENFIANGLVSHNTRWNEDDLSGWLLAEETTEQPEGWHIVNLPAICEETPVTFPPSCTVEADWRKSGEALCPERYPLERLDKIRARIGEYYWNALYQQRPTPREGLFFKRDWFPVVEALPASGLTRVRYWDKAGAAPGKGDYTVGCLMARHTDGLFYIEDVVRGQWTANERNAVILQTAQLDRERGRVTIHVEQPPGLAKESTDAVIRMLAGFSVFPDPVTKDKVERAEPFQAQAQAGNVRLLRGAWNSAYLNELCSFPNARHDDQVDGTSGAFNKLCEKRTIKLIRL